VDNLSFEIVPFVSCGKYKLGLSLADAKGLSSGKCFQTQLDNGGVALQYDAHTLVFSPMKQLESVVIPDGCNLCLDDTMIFSPSADVLPALEEKFGAPEKHRGDLFFRNAGLILSEFEDAGDYGRNISVCSKDYFERVLKI